MSRRLGKFKRSMDRHGLVPTLLRSAYHLLRRILYFEICRVDSSSDAPYDWPDVPGYETRAVDAEEFDRELCEELCGRDYRWAFERGDLCAASSFDGRIVGYNFTTVHPTRVADGLVFVFPDGFVYSFASFTSPSHRGRKLDPDRWKVSREVRRQRTGREPASIWYVNITNLESLASIRHSNIRPIVRGYAGFVRLFGRWFTFASPACRRFGAGFERAETT